MVLRAWIALSMVMGSKGDVLAGALEPLIELGVVAGDEVLRTALVFAADDMGKAGDAKERFVPERARVKLNFDARDRNHRKRI